MSDTSDEYSISNACADFYYAVDIVAVHNHMRAYNGRDSEREDGLECMGLFDDADELRRTDMSAVYADMVCPFIGRDNV